MRYLCLILLFPPAIAAGQVFVGVRGGIPVSKAFDYSSNPNRPDFSDAFIPAFASYASKLNPYTVGPSLEILLPLGFGAEFDALYRHLTYHYTGSGGAGSGSLFDERKIRANRWEFPILLKYRFPTPEIRPFLNGGISINHVRASNDGVFGFRPSGSSSFFDRQLRFFGQSADYTPELNVRTTAGVVVGGGVEFALGRFKVSPELRYTRWRTQNFDSGAGTTFLRSKLNEIGIIVGLMLRVR